jgi:hypothetical protein
VAELLRGVQGKHVDFKGFCTLMDSKFVSNQEAEQEIMAAFRVSAVDERRCLLWRFKYVLILVF